MGFFSDVGDVFKDVGNFVISPFQRAQNIMFGVAEKAGNTAGNVLDGVSGLASLFSNPMMWVAVGVGAFVILPKLLK